MFYCFRRSVEWNFPECNCTYINWKSSTFFIIIAAPASSYTNTQFGEHSNTIQLLHVHTLSKLVSLFNDFVTYYGSACLLAGLELRTISHKFIPMFICDSLFFGFLFSQKINMILSTIITAIHIFILVNMPLSAKFYVQYFSVLNDFPFAPRIW